MIGLVALLLPRPGRPQTCPAAVDPQPIFGSRTDSLVVGDPHGLALADFDGDGKLDFVVATQGGSAQVALGDGSGGFGPATPLLGGGDDYVVVGDFTNDGIPDLAFSDDFTDMIAIMEGDGTGGFSSLPSMTVGTDPKSMAVADFNRDGDLDIVVANAGSDFLSVLLGDGTGSFTVNSLTLPGAPAGTPQAVAVADFDRDGDDDLVVSVQGGPDVLIVLPGLGNGAFGTAVPVSLAVPTPVFVAVADMNQDGRPDIVTGDAPGSDSVSVHLANAGGGFGGPTITGVGGAAEALAIGDFDGNGVPDLAVTRLSFSPVTVMLGKGDGSFNPGLDLGADFSFFPAVGDLNRDGRADLAVAHVDVGGNFVSVFPNELGIPCPSASFGPAARSFGAGAFPTSIARGDFNGDGALDLVVTNETGIPGTVSILLATLPGFGGYGGPTTFTVGNTPRHVAVGSFNSDNNLDLAVANFGSNTVSILLGDGLGGFGPASSLATGGGQPTAAGIIDLNADGKADLAVTHGMSNFMSIFIGNGDGTFNPPTTVSVGSTGGSAVSGGDFNRDGRQDLAVAVKTSSQVAILLGDGTGGFLGPATTFLVGSGPVSLVVGDFDNDLDLDVATANETAGTVSVLFGLGNGNFSLPASTHAVGTQPSSLAAADLNGDGWLDLATSNQGSANASVLLGTGSGSFAAAVNFVSAGMPRGIIAAHLDGDGHLDLATVNNSAQSVLILSGSGGGSFGVAAGFTTVPATSSPLSASVGDFNRDGTPDLAVPGSGSVAILLGTGSGGLSQPPSATSAGTSPQHAAVGDFDRDGIVDLAVANLSSNDVSIRRGDGSGAFAPFAPTTDITSIPAPRFVATGDFDQDGKLDLAVAHGTNQVAIHGGNGSGGFAAATPLTVGTTPVFIAVADFNGDGDPDLAIANSASNNVHLCLGGSSLAFACGGPVGTGTKPVALAVADFDRDGDLDLAVANENPGGGGSISRLDNTDGMGTLVPLAPAVAAGAQPKGLVAADLDGDGLFDLAVVNFVNRNASVLLGNGGVGNWTFAAARSWGVGGQAVWLATADFDRDGRPDLVTANQSASNVSAILNTNCKSRRMGVLADVDPLLCPAPATTLTPPLVLRVLDDGGNRIRCDSGSVVASRLPPGPLGGTATRPVVDGEATFGDLFVNDSGRFRIQFEHDQPLLRTRSRSFSQGVAVTISGPTELCEGTPAIYNAGVGYDKYTWTLDGPAPPLSVSQHARVPGLSPGPHTLDVQAKQDACTAMDAHMILVQANVSNVSVTPPGLQTVCTSCTGATLTESHTGGGTVTYQWAFRRETDSPPHVDIPGQTASTYIVNGADFPGPGGYRVVVKTLSSLCGGPPVVSSNEVPVDVAVGPPVDAVQFFTITSKSGQNFLEWKNPAGFDTVDIHRIAGTPNCTFPTDPNGPTLFTTEMGMPGQFDSFPDNLVSNDTSYCYTIFVVTDPGPPRLFSSGRSNRGRPFNTSLDVKWAFSIGTASLAPPGVSTDPNDGIHVVANDNALYSIAKGATGGIRPGGFVPVILNGPSQSRPTTVLVTVPAGGGADRVIFLGSQGGTVHAISAAAGGAPLWNQAVAPPFVQAGVSGIFRAFPPGDFDYVFAATRVSGVDNRLHALNKNDGSPVVGGSWPFDGGAGGRIGIISGQPLVDYFNKRVYLTSFERNPVPAGDENTVWCVNIADGSPCWSGPRFHGNIVASPTTRGNRIYVGTLDGRVIALNATDGTFAWQYDSLTGQPVRDFVFPDRLSRELYFSTGDSVIALTEAVDQTSAALNWRKDYPLNTAPSTPIFLTGSTHLFHGDGNGLLHRLPTDGGLETAPFPITLGDGNATVGAPTIDFRQGFIYVGTDAGIIYAVRIP